MLNRTVSPRIKLIIGAVILIFGIWPMFLASQEKTPNLAEVQETAEEKIRVAEEKQQFEDATKAFESMLSVADPDGVAVASLGAGRVEGELKIVVPNSWFYEPKQIRLQAAQNLWQAWATFYAPDSVDDARILLVDGNGNQVGGSRGIEGSGSSIYVDD